MSLHLSNAYWRYRNINLLSITYAFRPRLRSRLTQGGRTFPWKPWVYGPWDSHPRLATHANILTPIQSTCPSGHASSLMERSPTHAFACRSFGSVLEPRVSSAQGLSASELLRTLLMVAASEPTSWLFLKSYILPHLVRHSGP